MFTQLIASSLVICNAEYINLSDLTGKAPTSLVNVEADVLKPRNPIKHLSRRVSASSGVSLSVCYFPQLSFALSRKMCKDLPDDVVLTQSVSCANVADVSALDLSSESKVAKFIKENKTPQPVTLSFGDCGESGLLPDIDPVSGVVAFLVKDDRAAILAEGFANAAVSSSYLVPVMALKASSLADNQSKVKGALSTAMHAATPVARKEALETIKAASVKLATLRN